MTLQMFTLFLLTNAFGTSAHTIDELDEVNLCTGNNDDDLACKIDDNKVTAPSTLQQSSANMATSQSEFWSPPTPRRRFHWSPPRRRGTRKMAICGAAPIMKVYKSGKNKGSTCTDCTSECFEAWTYKCNNGDTSGGHICVDGKWEACEHSGRRRSDAPFCPHGYAAGDAPVSHGHVGNGDGCCKECSNTENGKTDVVGDGCDTYINSYCGEYDDNDFTAADMCCICRLGKECVNKDNGKTDLVGDRCHQYQYDWCGKYDDDDFTSSDMCCMCRGVKGCASDGDCSWSNPTCVNGKCEAS